MTSTFTLIGANVATMAGDAPDPYGVIADAAVVVDQGVVAWVGPESDVPDEWKDLARVHVGGGLVTPGLVECHSQVLFGGVDEPGDIWTRALATRAASDDELFESALCRVRGFIQSGVTTLELKTGFGLDTETELRLLGLASRLRQELPIAVRITFLAGHAYPPDLDDEGREDYVINICDELLPAAAAQGGYDAVEVYCEEERGFSMEDSSTILETVYRKKVPTRVSADELSDSAGGALAPAFYSKAAIHLNYTDSIAVKAMGNAGTTAVLVPGPAHDDHGHRPPVDLLRESGVPIAVSTSYEPGAQAPDLLLAAHLASRRFGLTEEESLSGITRVAAKALALEDGTGTVVVGGPADLALWGVDDIGALIAHERVPKCRRLWSRGVELELAGL